MIQLFELDALKEVASPESHPDLMLLIDSFIHFLLKKLEGKRVVTEIHFSISPQDKKPWEKIPDKGNNRRMVQLWWEGYSAAEIIRKLPNNLEERTIWNKLSHLRAIYGEEIIPTDDTRKKRSGG